MDLMARRRRENFALLDIFLERFPFRNRLLDLQKGKKNAPAARQNYTVTGNKKRYTLSGTYLHGELMDLAHLWICCWYIYSYEIL